MKKIFYNKRYFNIILLFSIIICIFSTLRSIDTNGNNADDKFHHYIYAKNFFKTDKHKINEVIHIVQKSCSNQNCKNRTQMIISNNHNYPLFSLFILYFDNLFKNYQDDLERISKSFFFGNISFLIFSLIIFNIFCYFQNVADQKNILIFLIFIFIIDKYLLNINISSIFPKFNDFQNFPTLHMPRGYALFSGILSFLFLFNKQYFKTFGFICFSILSHLTFGIALLLILIFFFFFKYINSKIIKKFKLEKFYLLLIFSFVILIENFSLLPLLIVIYFILKKKSINYYEKNIIIYLFIISTILLSLDFFLGLINSLLNLYKYEYIKLLFENYLQSFNLIFFSYEKILNFSQSYFYYYLRHGPSRIYPLTALSLALILLVVHKEYLFNTSQKVIKKLSYFLLIIIILISPLILERLYYLKTLYNNHPKEIEISIKKEASYDLYVKNLKNKYPDWENINFVTKEVYSSYQVLKFYQNVNKK